MKKILSRTMASWNLIFCCLVVKDFAVTKTTRLDGIALFVTTRTSHSLVPNCLQSRQPGSFGGGHGLCGGDHEPLWGRSLHTPGGSRKSEGDPWFCSCVGDVQFLKCAHACVCDVAMHVHDKFLLQEWANLEGGKLKLVAQHVINLTYRTINARPYVCASS